MPTDCIYYDYGVFADIPCNILNFEYKGLGGCVSEQHIQIITKPTQPDTLTDYCHTELKSDKSKWDSAIAFMAIDIADNDGEDNTRTDDNTDTGNINNTIDASGHEKDIQVRSNDYKSAVGLALGALDIDNVDNTYDDEDGECIFCAGTGRTKEDPFSCAYCGTQYRNSSKELAEVDIAELAGVYIPWSYRHKDAKFDRERITRQLTESHNLNSSHKLMQIWLTTLEIYIGKLRERQVNPRQIIISTQPAAEKYAYEWIYSALEAALLGGYSTTHVLNPVLIDVKKFAYIDEDILFFELVSEGSAESMRKLEFICKYRMHRDKITFIVTSLSISELDKFYPVSNDNGIYTIVSNYNYRKPERTLNG